MKDAVFWASTPSEIAYLLKARTDRRETLERAATLRAGVVASAVYNVHRKKGKRPIKPSDFVRDPVRKVSPERAREIMDAWAQSQNTEEH